MGRLKMKVVPGSSRNQIVGWLGDNLKIDLPGPASKPTRHRPPKARGRRNHSLLQSSKPQLLTRD